VRVLEQLRRAGVSPGIDVDVVRRAQALDVEVIPGVGTGTEIPLARRPGSSTVLAVGGSWIALRHAIEAGEFETIEGRATAARAIVRGTTPNPSAVS
jgi:2-keto-3-deoxy-6-phosphogluconate aldolase